MTTNAVIFTLWRGSRLLGELRPMPTDDPDDPSGFVALLVPASDAPAFNGVWQIQ